MRRWAALLIMAGSLTAMPAMAAKTLSIDEMEQLLTKLQGRPDGKVASELDDVQLTERVSMTRLARWNKEFPGSRMHEQLMKLADVSAFLNPPASDVLRDPPPDTETQQRMLWMAVQYVKTTLSRLPDFFATRETTHFEDTLSQHATYSMGEIGMGRRLGGVPTQTTGTATTTEFKALHSTGAFSTTVTYRDGHEVAGEDAGKRKKEEPTVGLTSYGEFGPTMGAVIGDLVQSGVRWLRWEQGNGEPLAVFQYSVAANDSHFRVGIPTGNKVEETPSAYHGEIEIDPATGEILRLSELADMAPPNQTMRMAIVVEYAPVTIGDRSYVCPVKAVAFSKIRVPTAGTTDESSWPVQTGLNDIAFAQYHQFGSEARIVANADGSKEGDAATGGETPAPEATASAAPTGTPDSIAAAQGSSPSPTPVAETTPVANATPTPAAEGAVAPAANPGPTATAETAKAVAPPLPTDIADGTKGPWPTGTVLHAKSNLVLVDVVVTDHDRPVKGLDRGRFHVFEDGKEHPLVSFEENAPAEKVTVAEPSALPANTYSNVPTYPATGGVNVLLLDALNTPAGDQERVRRTMIQYLSTIRPGTAMAVFTLSSRLRIAAGFTTDVAKLLNVLQGEKAKSRLSPGVGSGSGSNAGTDIEHSASSIAVDSDPGTIWLVTQILHFAADMKTYDTDQRVAMTLDAFSALARYLAAVPGRKNLIWFSGSFPIGLWRDRSLSTPTRDLRDYSSEVQRTSELLAAARIAVYPVDARGLMTAPTADATYIPPPAFPSRGEGSDPTSVAVKRDNKSFTVQTSQEMGSMETIASETGGHAYSTGNDLKAAVDKIVANDSYYYALSYVPPDEAVGRHDDYLRKIEVKVDGGKYQLAYRQGYYPDDTNRSGGDKDHGTRLLNEAAELGAPQATQILFQARVLPKGDPQIRGPVPEEGTAGSKAASFPGGVHPYVVDLSVDPQDLTLAEEADGARRVQFKCALAAYNSEGDAVNSVGRAFDFELQAGQVEQLLSAGKGLPVRLAIDLPAGDVALRIVILDSASAKTGSLEIPIEIPGK